METKQKTRQDKLKLFLHDVRERAELQFQFPYGIYIWLAARKSPLELTASQSLCLSRFINAPAAVSLFLIY